jgi:hypothetical protein
VGVEPPRRETPWDHAPRPEPEPPPGLSTPKKVAAGVFIAVLYAGGMIWRGYVAPGIVGGILAGIVMFMVLKRIEERRRTRGR